MSQAQVTEGDVAFGDHRTWYRVTGDLGSTQPPVVTLHGGPGAPHQYLLAYAGLAVSGRPVVHYDQLGCGRSTHLPDRGADFWTIDLFLDELDNLLAELGVAEDYHLFGQSWGGILAVEHALRRPAGLRSMVLSNTPSSMAAFMEGTARLRGGLPAGVDAIMHEHEEAGTTDSAEYQEAMTVFYSRHMCRTDPWPDELLRSFTLLEEDPTVYGVMNGPSEFHVVGTLRDWSVADRLEDITVPTLLMSGSYDEVVPQAMLPFHAGLPDVRWEMLAESSHMPHLEQPERCLEIVGDFLDRQDAK